MLLQFLPRGRSSISIFLVAILQAIYFFSFLQITTFVAPTSARIHGRRWPQSHARAITCQNHEVPDYFDYSAKSRQSSTADGYKPHLQRREDDYSCSEVKPCSNGACCSKVSGYCGYGPESCGTNGQSPNDACWSNCDAKAECGRFSEPANKTCPLNVCCSEFGFCGMTEEFCAKSNETGKGCQSNCDQPGSGGSGGDVQSRIIGYYEAWQYGRSCSGLTMQDLPVESLTHLNFAFAFIKPGTYDIVPMDDLSADLFQKFTELKARNRALKTIISLGGWTFNDNGTETQPVFGDMVSSQEKRRSFIDKLFIFLQHYGFDGVDFDWEYPGAPDRGGHPDDGVNFTQLLKELQEAIQGQPVKYVVSFTAPTSYWYLRWFDIEEMTKHLDFVNVMSYDLHGTWDATNPIGNNIYGHSNLTEIDLALNLFWRNHVEPGKINLGMGFYGRSFQLADPSCWQAGCPFKGGAKAGGCTGTSGFLSYKEISEIIEQENLSPYHDKEAAVKYITWNSDQWVSYDDQDTFQQKIKYANKLGLGGLLIWAVDQDIAELAAMRGLLYPKPLALFNRDADSQSYWEDAALGDCRVTDCGGKCNPGEVQVTTQPCGKATPVFRHSSQADSALCCPISSAPDPKDCRWEGGAPSCNGHCHPGQVATHSNRWGDGAYCEDGLKFYCCDIPGAKQIDCSWKDQCDSSEVLMTFAGTFLEDIADIAGIFGGLVGLALSDALNGFDRDLGQDFCCSQEEAKKWSNCQWHGQPGSCFDNHCDTGKQVQLAESKYGFGESCFPRLERSRSFCCDPADGQSPFLPVPLDYLFPNAPDEEDVDVDFKLKVDPTWGTGSDKPGADDDPNDAAFGFVILTSPEAIQQTLDKRDGSHWELFDCFDSTSEEEQTIRMVCADDSPSSNCHKIHLGHGAPGTIVEMPEGCGPGKYAVVKDMAESKNQSLPSGLRGRGLESAIVYDLSFDYDFTRVPGDLGDTMMRVDYSNERGYWDTVVDRASATSKQRKRSLAEHGGNHKRWLEEEWRDDLHFGGVDREELHRRWFGSDVIDWLRNLLGVAKVTKQVSHSIDETLVALLIDAQWGPCPVGGASAQANLNIKAQAHVHVDTNFGLTIIAKLDVPPDLSQSYLFFKNKGEVTAKFTMDAVASVVYDTGPKQLFGLDNFPGATFLIPGILTVGPNFKLMASVDTNLVVAGHLESQVNIVNWDTQQTYPQANAEFEPQALEDPDRDGTQVLGTPSFDYSVSARGQVTAHLLPTITFGIDFDPRWNVPSAKVDLVADGWLRLMASAEFTNNPATCPFTYSVDAGADLYAQLTVPDLFKWGTSNQKYPIGQIPAKTLVSGGTCPQSQGKRDYTPVSASDYSNNNSSVGRRDMVIGPLMVIPERYLQCPGSGDNVDLKCPLCGTPEEIGTSFIRRRDDDDPVVCLLPSLRPDNQICTWDGSDGLDEKVKPSGNASIASGKALVKRAPNIDDKWYAWEGTNYWFAGYPACSSANIPSMVTKWYHFRDDTSCIAEIARLNRNGMNVGSTPIKGNFASDHVFEVQLAVRFFKWLAGLSHTNPLGFRPGYTRPSQDWVEGILMGEPDYTPHANYPPFMITDQLLNHYKYKSVWAIIRLALMPSNLRPDLMAILSGGVNGAKRAWIAGDSVTISTTSLTQTIRDIRDSAGVFNFLSIPEIWSKFTGPSNQIEDLFWEFDQEYPWGTLPGEPVASPGRVRGIRPLWCWWIERSMEQVDRNAASWRTLAASAIGTHTGGNGQAERYRDGEFTTGWSSAARMSLPKPNNGQPGAGSADGSTTSRYGLWGTFGHGAI
ncbi:hypothetical protein BDN72DRAFT_162975 [Pluteus cervinus]|uniref:Uncharacterized protein n=1 Tax=Pluteus cervinus TaxID=181527 RepID=A0ACD3AJZ9_9AGAR|nr:hypothetical protein BDN72DRAFT_162975 [Pluteus cervinus]